MYGRIIIRPYFEEAVGEHEIVKPMIEAYPELLLSKGPHGLDLIHHATKGGEPGLKSSTISNRKPD